MRNRFSAHLLFLILFSGLFFLEGCQANPEAEKISPIAQNTRQAVIQELVKTFGEGQRARIEQGVSQVAERWQSEDGDANVFRAFCRKNFYPDSTELENVFLRYQRNLEILYGNLHRIYRGFLWYIHVDEGPILPVDYLFAKYDAFAHVKDDMFTTKIAFAALLNFPLPTLEEKINQGLTWSRHKWAEVRLAEKFRDRIPASLEQQRSQAYVAADDYISNYNIYMGHLLTEEGRRLFPQGLKLISHWGLRDELKAQYANPDGLARQRLIQKVMERIIRQEIPEQVINNPAYDWDPLQNKVFQAGSRKVVQASPEPNTRYRYLLNIFRAERKVDPYTPDAPSLMARRFRHDREIPEKEVEKLLTEILTAPVLKDIAALIQKRLNRPLEPFDIWYNGFRSQANVSESDLDRIVSRYYPNVTAFQKDLPRILMKLGFSPQKAAFLANHIEVDPSRGAGHAMGALMREDKAHLRTRIPKDGMKYKGFNIAIHELGHNVEQVFSLNEMDYYTLHGVPNTAFTEAFAFVFQSRDLEVLGVSRPSAEAENLRALDDLWSAFEISGVALVDMYIWRWMYQHPTATPAEVKEAMLQIAKQVWNQYFAPVIGRKDQILLAIYSHIIDSGMYIPDYPLGQIISFQIEQYLKTRNLATEMERMCKLGKLAPQVWMQKAVGEKISPRPLIEAAERAVKQRRK